MKCLPRKEVPTGAEWLYELKFDGYRSLAILRQGQALLLSRNSKPLNGRFPSLVAEIAKIPAREAVLDGEIVALDEKGRHSFQLLQNYEQEPPLIYYLFDLLSLDGEDWTHRPLEARKARLQKLIQDVSPRLLFSGELPGSAGKIWKMIRQQRLEGLIAKRRKSSYEPGQRSGQWLKIKSIQQQDFVIGGFTKPKGGRSHFGALLVGVHEKGGLRFCGKVGTGFDQKRLASLFQTMRKKGIARCPFFNLPQSRANRWGGGITASEMKLCSWIEPTLICEIRFTEWTGEGSLRHPSFTGMRDDISPQDVHREAPKQ
jgi:bifunctional non-homologous end joining protein LigD